MVLMVLRIDFEKLMMSHYGLPCEYDDHWICGSLELSIETLAGTAFEIKVSPNDTIMSIKSKIQSVEGIPVSEQHLLYNLEELENSASVKDYSIQNGATLKLVLSMRGGPVTTKKLPPVDEVAWKELQEFMSVAQKDDLFDRLPSGARVTVLVFKDGDQVNLLRVIENEDGSFSPLSESWNGSSIRNLFIEEDPEESDKRLKENSVTMGKMQELREKLQTLSIQRKEKKSEDPIVESKVQNLESSGKPEILRPSEFMSFPSKNYSHSNCMKFVHRTQLEADRPTSGFRPRSRLISCSDATMAALTKARKEAENIIRMQSNLSVLVDSESSYMLRRTPLPEIRRSPDNDVKKEEEMGKLREKTARFEIVEEENELTTGLCSSQSSVVGTSEEVAIAYSPIPREGITRSRFRVSRYVLDSEERPKTTPGKLNRESKFCNLEPETRKRTTHIFLSNVLPPSSTNNQADVCDEDKKSAQPKARVSKNPSFREEPPVTILPAVVKKRLRCSQCKKKLNITNTYTCRCGRTFCALHRYSEVHNCVFDYKEEGRRYLQQTNPLVAASKLPKI